jgi:hypothetical protein
LIEQLFAPLQVSVRRKQESAFAIGQSGASMRGRGARPTSEVWALRKAITREIGALEREAFEGKRVSSKFSTRRLFVPEMPGWPDK